MSGDEIKATRERLGETQEAFAKRLGIRQATLSRWETEENAPRGAAKLFLERMLAELNE